MPEINEYGYQEHQILEVEGFHRAPSFSVQYQARTVHLVKSVGANI